MNRTQTFIKYVISFVVLVTLCGCDPAYYLSIDGETSKDIAWTGGSANIHAFTLGKREGSINFDFSVEEEILIPLDTIVLYLDGQRIKSAFFDSAGTRIENGGSFAIQNGAKFALHFWLQEVMTLGNVITISFGKELQENYLFPEHVSLILVE